ncbi:MAG TPA: peptide ABC transporter substrate-binding protein [Verrucomicrobiae bacterium]
MLLILCGGCAFEQPAELRIINGKEPETLDPATATGQPDGRVIQSMFEGLTRYNATNAAPEPGLAMRWEISPDGKTYTFHLRTNALWSTGEPITSRDIEYSWMRVLDPRTASDYVGNLFYIQGAEDFHLGKGKREDVGIKVVGDHLFQVELINPTPFFLDLCAFPTQAAVHRATIEKHGERWLKARPLPVSGPYDLVSWRLNDRIRLKKNPNYWDAENTAIKTVDLFPVNSQNTALNLFANGGVDVVWDKDVVPTELIDVLSQRKDFHRFNYLGTYFLRFNVTRKPFDDVRVRKALALAVDHEHIQRVMLGSITATNIYVPPLANYTSAEGLKRDPELARQLLKEAGFENGKGFPRVEYLSNTSRDHEKIAVQLQAMWQQELGIRIELRAVEWKVYLNSQSKKDYDISRSAWVGDYADPNTFLDLFMANNPNNRTGWKSERYDGLMRTANATVDKDERAKLLQQAEAMLIREELPIVPIYIYVGFNFFDPDVIKGIHNQENIRDEHPIRAIRKLAAKID